MSPWERIDLIMDWLVRRGYWPPKFRLLVPGDQGFAEEAIEELREGDDVDGIPRDGRGPG